MCAGDLRAAGDVVPEDIGHAADEIASSALRRSSSLVDQAAAAGHTPSTAMINIARVVVLAAAAPAGG